MMVSKKDKNVFTLYLNKNALIQTIIDCVAALSTMLSIVFGSLVQQVWPALSY